MPAVAGNGIVTGYGNGCNGVLRVIWWAVTFHVKLLPAQVRREPALIDPACAR